MLAVMGVLTFGAKPMGFANGRLFYRAFRHPIYAGAIGTVYVSYNFWSYYYGYS